MGNLSLQLLAIIPANLAYGSWKLFTVGLLSYRGTVIAGNIIEMNAGPGVRIWSCESATLSGNTINENLDSGIHVLESELVTIQNNEIKRNSSETGGGLRLGRMALGSVTVTQNTFDGNTARSSGGAIHMSECYLRIFANEFARNRAAAQGGAIYVSPGGQILDEEGNLLPIPDTCNSYTENKPDDIYYE